MEELKGSISRDLSLTFRRGPVDKTPQYRHPPGLRGRGNLKANEGSGVEVQKEKQREGTLQ